MARAALQLDKRTAEEDRELKYFVAGEKLQLLSTTYLRCDTCSAVHSVKMECSIQAVQCMV